MSSQSRLAKRKTVRNRRLLLEQLDHRHMLASDWRNPADSLDVDNDHSISPLDVLSVINRINTDPNQSLAPRRPANTNYFDVDGDESVSPLDVLILINYINLHGSGSRSLRDLPNVLADETSIFVTLGQTHGSRLIHLELAPSLIASNSALRVNDLVNVFLVDPNNPGKTLLDNGVAGTPIFQIEGNQPKFVPGISSWNGSVLTIDASAIHDIDTGLIKVQLLNLNGIASSQVVVRSLSNTLDPNGFESPTLGSSTSFSNAGLSLDIATLNASTELVPFFENVRYDSVLGKLNADMFVLNRGTEATGRDTVVLFPNIPASVGFDSPSGITASGVPYINFRNAIPPGGLGPTDRSAGIRVSWSDRTNAALTIGTSVLTGLSNRAPQWTAPDPVSIMPGDSQTILFQAADPDDDPITYSIRTNGSTPSIRLLAGGRLEINPTSDQVGSYIIDVIAFDGQTPSEETLSIDVVVDPITSTRVSGRLLNVDESPIVGLQVEIGSVVGLTQTDGSFSLDLGLGTPVTDTLRVRGDLLPGPTRFPFIAEKLGLLFEHALQPNVNNVLVRPIYLPQLNDGTAIDPMNDTEVAQVLQSGEAPATVHVKAGTLFNQQGTPFTGRLSVTEVPANRTPAVLPPTLTPGIVVTIQPGEMVFVVPTPLNIPNREGWAPMSRMDLWSINPSSGQFDKVGVGQVSADGQTIDTISGGIRNSSWHFFVPPPVEIEPIDEECEECESPSGGSPCDLLNMLLDSAGNSEPSTPKPADLSVSPKVSHKSEERGGNLFCQGAQSNPATGNLQLPLPLFAYRSKGQVLGGSILYDSERVLVSPTLGFTLKNLAVNGANAVVASAQLQRGNVTISSETVSAVGSSAAKAFWSIPTGQATAAGALQSKMTSLPTGTYEVQINASVGRADNTNSRVTGSSVAASRSLPVVNSLASIFGAGWGLAGLEEIVMNPNGSALVVRGDGTEVAIGAPKSGSNTFQSRPGDYSTTEKMGDGSFQRIYPDQTKYMFSSVGKLETVRDRNSLETNFFYDSEGRINRVVDTTGKSTSFFYSGAYVSRIVDPANREVFLEHDGTGNLTRVTYADGTSTQMQYNSMHLMTSLVDPKGSRYEFVYDSNGNLIESKRPDNSSEKFASRDGQLFANAASGSLSSATKIGSDTSRFAAYADGAGRTTKMTLDNAGQVLASSDGGGLISKESRDPKSNLITEQTSGRGFNTQYTYNGNGDVTSIRDDISSKPLRFSKAFADQLIPVDGSIRRTETGDLNGDGIPDLVEMAEINPGLFVTSIFFARSDGSLGDPVEMQDLGFGSRDLKLADLDGDGDLDMINHVGAANFGSLAIYLNRGDGSFEPKLEYATGFGLGSISVGRFDSDDFLDVLVVSTKILVGGYTTLLGDGSGGFRSVRIVDYPRRLFAVDTGDINSDGRIDFVAAAGSVDLTFGSLGYIASFLGQPDGTFVESNHIIDGFNARSIKLNELNGDSRIDLLAGNDTDRVRVLTSTANSSFSVSSDVIADGPVKDIQVGDVDGDGDLDAFANVSPGLHFKLTNNGGVFSRSESFLNVGSVTFGDLNQDNVLDLVVTNSGDGLLTKSELAVTLGDGFGNFGDQHQSPPLSQSQVGFSAIGDFNGDGKGDIATTTLQGVPDLREFITVQFGDGAGGIASQRNLPLQFRPLALFATDADNDGDIDLVSVHGSGFEVLLDDGLGNFTAGQVVDLGFIEVVNGAKLIDADFDGRNDLVFRMTRRNLFGQVIGNSVACFFSRDVGFLRLAELQLNEQFSDFDLTDADGDGNAEIITIASVPIGNGLDHLIRYYPGIGFGSWGQPVEVGRTNDNGHLAFWDADKKNLEDILYVGSNGQPTTTFISTGASPGFTQTTYGNGSGDTFVTVEDIDRDGFDDLLTVSVNGFYTFWRNDGDGRLDEQVSYLAGLVGADIRSIAIGDLNGDKLPDIVLTSNQGKRTLIRLNLLSVNGNVRSSERFEYDSVFAQTTSHTDDTNRTTLFTLDPTNGNALEERVVFGAVGGNDDLVTTYTYNFLGLVTSMTDPRGIVTEYEYDAICQLIAIHYAVGTVNASSMLFSYDAAGNLLSLTDELGRVTRYEYDVMGRLKKLTEADADGAGPNVSGVSSILYDANGLAVKETDSRGFVTTYTYDVMDRVVSMTDAVGATTQYQYDASGNIVRTTDGRGFVSYATYDSRDRLATITNPDGGTSVLGYDSSDNLTTITDPLGRTWRNVYDERDRLIQSIDALGQVQQNIYNAADELVVFVARNGQRVLSQYDEAGRIVALTDNAGSVTRFEYDGASNNTAIVDALGRRTEFSFDSRNRNTSSRDPLGGVRTTTYDAVGNEIAYTDSLGHATSMEFDSLNQIVTLTDAIGAVSHFAYDTMGNLVSLKDPLGRTTQMSYDGLSRLTARTDALGNTGRSEFDANGNLISATDKLGRRTTFAYDSMDRVIRQTDPIGGISSFQYDLVGNNTASTDELGRSSRSTFDALNRTTVMTDPLGGTSTMEYDAVGNVISSTDELGRRTRFRYDNLSRLFEIVNADNGVTTYTMDALGNRTAVKDPLGRTTRFDYDALDRIVKGTDPLGQLMDFTFDAEDNLVSQRDKLGNVTTYVYDAVNRKEGMTNALGFTQTYTYDLVDNLTESQDELGRRTQYQYDAIDRMVKRTNAIGGISTIQFDAVGNATGTTDELGRTTAFSYDALDRMISMTNALGDSSAMNYDAVGNAISATDELGRRSQTIYDSLNRPTRLIDPLGHETRFAYDPYGNQLSMTDALGAISRYRYDSLNRMVGMTDALGGIYSSTFDAVGNRLTNSDPLSRTTSYQYDALDRMIATTNPIGNTSRMTYDRMDNVVSTADPLGLTTRSEYDALYRQTATIDPAGGRTEFSFDRVGNTVSVLDPGGNTTSFAYDDLNRMTRDTNSLGKSQQYEFDAVGNLILRTDRNGRQIRLNYDSLDRQTQEQWLNAQGQATRAINTTFDKASQITGYSDPDAVGSFSYDADGRIVQISNAGTPHVPSVVWGLSYDSVDNLTQRTESRDGSVRSTKSISYDLLHRPTKLTESGPSVALKRIEYTFDAASQLTRMDRFKDAVGGVPVISTDVTQDAAGRLTSLVHRKGIQSRAEYTFEYDAADRITKTTSVDGVSNYQYDVRSQLTQADHASQTDEAYTYDANGNRTGSGYQTGLNNRLVEDAQYRYEYDDEGNRTARVDKTSGDRTEYEWDYRNRLTSVIVRSSSGAITSRAQYVYDPTDNRIGKIVDSDGDGPAQAVEERFVYDGLNLTLAFDGGGNLTHRYLHGLSVDSVLAHENALGEVLWTLPDQVGTIRDLADNTGAIVNHRIYDSFGKLVSQTDAAVDTVFGFTGQQFDRETGLSYYRARYYDPATGRFLSEDPLGFGAGDANLSRYVGNSPTNATDPLGLETYQGGIETTVAGVPEKQIVMQAMTPKLDNSMQGSVNSNNRPTQAQRHPEPVHHRKPQSKPKKKSKGKVCKPSAGSSGGAGGGHTSSSKGKKLTTSVTINHGVPPSAGLATQVDDTLKRIKPILDATLGAQTYVKKTMKDDFEAQVKLVITLTKASFEAAQGHFQKANVDFDETGIPKTLRGIAEAARDPRKAFLQKVSSTSKAIAAHLEATQKAAKSGDYRQTAYLNAKAVDQSIKFILQFGQLDLKPIIKTVPIKARISMTGAGGAFGAHHTPLLQRGVPHPDRESHLYGINQEHFDKVDKVNQTMTEALEAIARRQNCVNCNLSYWKSKIRNKAQPAMVSALPVHIDLNREMWELGIDAKDLKAFDWKDKQPRKFYLGGQQARNSIVDAVKNGPVGGGGIVTFASWNPKDGIGHVFTVERDPIHGVLFIDPQLGRSLTQDELRGFFAPGKKIQFFHLM